MKKLFRKEVIAIIGVALTALSVGLSKESSLARFEARSAIPASLYMPTKNKRVACFITINSNDERTVFSKYLDPKEWDIVELTADTPSGKEGWFDQACAKNIKCDINVISGHFAGRFFGTSGYILPLAELESRSCAQDCRGVLENPREVYLFGCNTLATKEKDSRTPEEYYTVLRADGYTHDMATRVVEDRYGSFGQDNLGKVQRAFIKVPYIYGFHSKSPLGSVMSPMLEKYMQTIGDFTKHFDSISAQRSTAKSKPNTVLTSALKGTAITQCSGLDPADPEYKYHLMICALFDARTSMDTRLTHADEILNNERILSLLPSVQHFLRSNIVEIKTQNSATFAILQKNAAAKKLLMESIEGIRSPLLKIEWIRFARLMGWVTQQQFLKNVYDLVASAFADTRFNLEAGDTICGLRFDGLDRMDFSGIVPLVKKEHALSLAAANTFACIGLARYPEFRVMINESLREKETKGGLDSGDTDRLSTIFYRLPVLSNSSPVDQELLSRLKNLCVNYPSKVPGASCGKALATLGARDAEVAPILVNLLKTSGDSAQALYALAFRPLEVGKELIEDAMLDIYANPAQVYWFAFEDYFEARPILKPANQRRALQLIVSPPKDRRPESLLYGLREMALSRAEFDQAYLAIRGRKSSMMTGAVVNGWLNIALKSKFPNPVLEKIIVEHSGAGFRNERELNTFYGLMANPQIRSVVNASKAAKASVCRILKFHRPENVYNEFGELLEAAAPAKSCEEVLK